MAEVPAEAVTAAQVAYARALYDRPTPTVLSDETLMRIILEAAAPAMAGHVARAVERHGDENGPQPGTPDARRTWRRHFRIAAQVASLAFSTEEDIRRMAAEALNRGDFIACPAAEAGEGE